MKKYRFAVRTILYPEKSWLTIPTSQLREEIRKTLVFNSAGTANETIEKWRKQQYEVIIIIRKQIEQKLNPKKIGIPNLEGIQISSHKFKEMFRHLEELSENNLIIPFYSIQAKAIQQSEQIGTITHLIQIFPAGPVIIKSLVYTKKSNINKTLRNNLLVSHKAFLNETDTIITKIMMKTDSETFYDKKGEKIKLSPKTTANFSSLTINRIKKKNMLSSITKIYKDNDFSGINSFVIETNQSAPKKIINKAETLIDWFFAFKGFLDWIGKKINAYKEWSIHEWVYYYSLLTHVFNPENYYDAENAYINPIRMVRNRYLRDLWNILITDSPGSIIKWRNNINSFLELVSRNMLLFSKFFDESYNQLIIKKLNKIQPNSSNTFQHHFNQHFPNLNCKEATILTMFIELGKLFFTNEPTNPMKTLLTNKIGKERLNWPKLVITRDKNKNFNPELVEDKGWIRTNLFRDLLVYDKTLPEKFSSKLFQRIPNKDCNRPVFDKWHPNNDFYPVPGRIINSLIDKKLVEVKMQGKSVLLRVNIHHPFIQHLILTQTKEGKKGGEDLFY